MARVDRSQELALAAVRWKALIPALVFTAAVALFALFFADWAVEWAVEKAGTAVNGAKVELDGVSIDYARLGITLKRLQVTDKAAPMTNAVEVERMTFALAPKPLAWKKIVIEQGEIIGVRTGTPRKTSGALPAEPKAAGATEEGPGAAARAKDAAKEAAAGAAGRLKEQFDPGQLKAEDLESYKRIQAEKERLAQTAAAWEQRADSIKTDGTAGEVRAWVDKARKADYAGLEGAKRAKDALEEGKRHQETLKALGKSLADAKAALSADIANTKGALKEINDLKTKDMDAALAQVKGAASAEGLARSVIGPAWFEKLSTWLGWFERVRAVMPTTPKKGEKPEPPIRKGKDIVFPFHYAWPSFWLKESKVTGQTSGDAPLSYEGSLTNVSTDPKLVAKPMALKVDGKQGPRALHLGLTLDYRKDTPREALDFSYSGLTLDGTRLGDAGGAVSIKQGSGSLKADLEARGPKLAGAIAFLASPVALAHDQDPAQAKQKLMAIVHDVLVKLNKLDAKVTVGGTVSTPHLGLKTSLDKSFADAVKKVLQKELDEMKAKIRARINELVDGEKAKLEGQVNAKSAGALDKFKSKEGALKSVQAELDKVQDELKSKAAASATGAVGGALPKLPAKKKLF